MALNRGRFALATPYRTTDIASLPLMIADTLPHETSAISLDNIFIAQLIVLKYTRRYMCFEAEVYVRHHRHRV